MTTRVLTIDLDNTLWDTPPVITKAEEELYIWLAQHCPIVTQQYSREQLTRARQQFAIQHTTITHKLSSLRKAFLAHIINACGYEHADEKAAIAFNIFYTARQKITLFDGALLALKSLKKDYRLIAITNGNADLTLMNLDMYFEKILCAEDYPAPKPEPDMFLAALDYAQCPAFEVVHIGDHPIDDILGAQNIGMKTIWVNLNQSHWKTGEKPTATITHLDQLATAVKRIR